MWSLEEAFDHFPDAVGVIEAVRGDGGEIVDFVVTYTNPELVRISGSPADRLVGRRLLDIVPSFRTNGAADAYRGVIANGGVWETEIQFDGTVADVELHGRFEMRAVRLGDGALCTYRDVTALRAAEEGSCAWRRSSRAPTTPSSALTAKAI